MNIPPTTGPVLVVGAKEMESMTREGWQLIAILQETQLFVGMDQEQAHPNPNGSSGYHSTPGLVSLIKNFIGQANKYVLTLERGDSEKWAELAEERDRALTLIGALTNSKGEATKKAKELEGRVNQLTLINDERGQVVDKLRAELREAGEENKKLKTGTLEADMMKAIGADRVSEIVGHVVIDPDPLLPAQVQTAFDRLLEDDDADAQAR